MRIRNDTGLAVGALPGQGAHGQFFLTVVIKAAFDLIPGGPADLSREQPALRFTDAMNPGGSLHLAADTAPFKPRADIALLGAAHAPGRRPVPHVDVHLRVGNHHQRVRVHGERRWRRTLFGWRPMRAAPFTRMALTFERAFGGEDATRRAIFAANPAGRGFFAPRTRKTIANSLLPNLEDPRQPIRSPWDRRQPAGFGFIAGAWAGRSRYLGTYDERWRHQQAPDLAEDFRFGYYNAAHPGLQVKGYLRGDEPVRLVHATRAGDTRFRLSGLCPTVTVVRRAGGRGQWHNIAVYENQPLAMHLDTLCLMPDEGRLYQLWRGLCLVHDRTLQEIKEIRLALTNGSAVTGAHD